jgi:NADPH:quinone reductase-like Zn-dependent oxidoreductase
MKAAVNTRYGQPEVVSVVEVNKPVPKDHEILIKVHASTVNRTDCGFRSAEYFVSRFWSGLFKPKFQTLGCEFAGEVEALGKNVTLFKAGDRVFGFNDLTFGGHAEYMTIDERAAVAVIPNELTYEEAAPITEGAHYALCNIRAAKIRAGHHVMVYGATGAIGSAAVQLLKYFDVRVTAVCNTPNVALVKSLGADTVIDYLKEDFAQCTEKFDCIFDAVGKSSFAQCKPLLKDKGVYMSTELGRNAENIILALITPLTGGKKVLFPLPTITKEDVIFLRELVMKKQFKPLIDRTYQLNHIVAAYQYVETGQKTGNVVLVIRNESSVISSPSG